MLSSQEQRRRIAEELARISRLPGKKEAARPAVAKAVDLEQPEPIAIIGLSGYFPGCMSVEAFWEAVDQDRCLLAATPQDRLDLWHRLLPETAEFPGMQGGGFIPDIRGFAPDFFKILPVSAHGMDPRQRLLLMSVYHALEDAGYAPGSLKQQPVGVFVGIEEDEYFQTMLEAGVPLAGVDGLGASMVANRLSWHFDFRGPSEVVNTMCSGGAVALHRAVCSLRSGESTMAVVGAANLLLRPEPFLGLGQTGQLSPDLAVRSFGKGANGFLRAEGVASVILKRLSEAERDGDPIYAVIRHSAVNFNGKGGMSIAAPDIAAHAELIARCYRQAGVDPREVQYIEAQGMGNPLADLAEWQAFNRALSRLAEERGVTLTPGACRVGTLKPMLGHMHSASALGALCKIVHCLRTGTIHKILGFSELHPELEEAGQPCAPARDTEPWHTTGSLRLAGIHAYGAGGNNAHILIEEYRDARTVEQSTNPVILPISAESAAQRLTMVRQLLAAARQHPEYTLASLAGTLQRGRDVLPMRVAFVAGSQAIWREQAEAYLAGQTLPGVFEGNATTAVKTPSTASDAASLAQAWVQGAAVDWPVSTARRVRLPGYPFALKECWHDRLPRPSSSNNGAEKIALLRERAESIVRALLSRYLEKPTDQIGLDAAFVDQGFSSILVAELATALRREHSVSLEPARFFEFKTPRQLVRALIEFSDKTPGNISKPSGNGQWKAAAQAARDPGDSRFLPIAIIGLAGRYPAAPTVDELWANLRAGRECISEVPADHWNLAEHFDPNPETAAKNGKSYGKWGGFIDGLHEFDPLFFKISPLEAETMNPKERLALQTVWHVLEDAGYPPESLAAERVGVFFGVTRAGWDPYPGTFSSVANRVSYYCDFHGPSVSVDTMCSSSLTALHEACQHLQTGGCDVAVAGGVNLYLHPSHFVVLAHGRFLSPDGKCRAFGAGANGMTPGEGVGAVLLKPLARAVRDGDRIYGVIRGSASNHGGAANGFTVPNPEAQKDLVLQALRIAGVNPREISYVEAHGTGTVLGDPVEIRGLTEAYRAHSGDCGFCRLGSLKSNLGHLEAAAGIASLTKVLAQMKHGELAASLHAAELNPHIDFSKTPFVVQQALEPWQPKDAQGRPMPRVAAISSFGAGGSNVHLIVEEFSAPEPVAGPEPGPQLIVLSARNEDRLREVARGLRDFVRQHPDTSLRNLAYTFQVGRAAMEERLAVGASSLAELSDKLDLFLRSQGECDGLWRGHAETRRRAVAEEAGDDSLAEWLRQGDLEKLGKAWVKGGQVPWSRLYSQDKPKRIGLPLYPFAKMVIAQPNLMPEPDVAHELAALHPLAQRNVSTLHAQRIASTLTGREFFLAHHVVAGRKTLSAAACLEMARAAVEQSLPSDSILSSMGQNDVPVVRCQQIVWARPLCIDDGPKEVRVAVNGNPPGPVDFEIRALDGQKSGEEIVYGQGSIEQGWSASPPVIDLDALRASASLEYSAEQCYAAFTALGIDYGPGHRGLDKLYAGPALVLARLRLPEAIQDTASQYVLHPSLLDAAFQATIGFGFQTAGIKPVGNAVPMNGKPEPGQLALLKPCLPYAIEQMEVFQSCVPAMWAIIRRPAHPGRGGSLETFDLDLCDDQGVLRVRLRGFASRILPPAPAEDEKPSLLLRIPKWEASAAVVRPEATKRYARRIVVVCGLDVSHPPQLEVQGGPENTTWMHVPLKGKSLAKDYMAAGISLFGAIRSVLEAKLAGDSLIQVLLGSSGACRAHSGLVGMLRTARLEMPRLCGQLIQVDKLPAREQLAEILEENANAPDDTWIRYQEGRRLIAAWSELPPASFAAPWKPNGVYLITGGLGGLGRIFAEEIAQKATKATLILWGRSELGEDGNRFLRGLRSRGLKAIYQQVDLRQRDNTKAAVQAILAEHGALHGILHTAGVLRDQYLRRKTPREIEVVFGPKVAGTVNLDEATRDVALDFLVLFSSGATLGNPGQGDYAAANGFLDGFASYRNKLVASGARQGATYSIAWPYWREGGMRMDAAAQKSMREESGLFALETPSGLEAFYCCIASRQAQVQVLYGLPQRMNAALAPAPIPAMLEPEMTDTSTAAAVPVAEPDGPVAGDELNARVVEYLQRLIGETLKIKPSDMRGDKDLYGYGLDSIIALEVNQRLEQDFPRLSKTLFFEYATIQELAGYFVQAHRPILKKMFVSKLQPSGPEQPSPEVNASAPLQAPAPKSVEPPNPAPSEPAKLSAPERPDMGGDTPLATRAAEPIAPVSPRNGHPANIDEILRASHVEIIHPAPRISRRNSEAQRWPNWHSVFQSFPIFESIQPEFSFSRMLAGGAGSAADSAQFLRGQLELRRLLFRQVDFSQMSRIVDIGCGRAADLMELALSHPQLRAEGLTLDAGEADFTRHLMRRKGLSDRVRVLTQDNATHEYEPGCDLAFSIQVMHFIPELDRKRALFRRLAAALRPDGVVLMVEFVSLLSKPMRDPALNTTVHTAGEWAEILGENGLILEEAVDLSSEIANFLHDPNLEPNIVGLDAARQLEIRKYHRQGNSLEKRWVAYCALRVRKDRQAESSEQRIAANRARLSQPISLRQARNGRVNGHGIAYYQELAAHFEDCVMPTGQPLPEICFT